MGLVAHPVFKTGRAEQPSAWKVRFLRRSVEGKQLGASPEARSYAASQGFEARCLQHEIDHLDGILFLDRVDSLARDVFRRKTYH